jgi:uncharacterized protein YcbX
MTNARSTTLGVLTGVWRYPVKSMRGEALSEIHVATDGLDGDRRRALVLTTPEHSRTGKPYRGKEHNLLHTQTDAGAAQALIAERGLAVEVREDDGPFFDDQPVSLLLDCWLHELEALLGVELDPLRFRPNLYVETARPCGAETALVGATIAAGDVLLRVVSPIVRCVTPTYDQKTGESNPGVLRALAQHRDTLMGVYCSVERSGRVTVGDRVSATVVEP